MSVVLAGCGSGALSTVDVKILQNGAPVAGAEVLIEPDTSGKGSVFGITKDDGTCTFDWGRRKGLIPGKYRIAVTQFEGDDGKPVAPGEEGQVQKQTGKATRKGYLYRRELTPGKISLGLSIESADEQLREGLDPNAPALVE